MADDVQLLYPQEEIDNFKCIFDIFDKEKTGSIDISDLQTIMRSLGRDPHEAVELLQEMQLSQPNKMNFQEFLKIMKVLENKLTANNNNNDDAESTAREASIGERNKYGSLLPRTGVHFLPDSKVVDFLKLLDDYRKKCIKDMNLVEARRAQLKFEDLRAKETLRQLQNMRQAQEQELTTVENAQRSQFLEFSQAWDNYMSDYEATAYLSLEKLKEKHILEMKQLQERIRKEFKVKLKFTKELMDMKKQVHTLISLNQLEEAEILKNECQKREEAERLEMDNQIDDIIVKQEERLRAKQQMALAALLKRIQRDRNEQLKHRQIDSQRLIQRNKNLLLDLLNKQSVETRRTNQFLKFALGARSPERKSYYKSKFFTALEDAKLKVDSGDEQNKTMYNANHNNSSLVGIKNQSQQRAKTSKGNTQARMQSLDAAAANSPPRLNGKGSSVKRINVKDNQEKNKSFTNIRSSLNQQSGKNLRVNSDDNKKQSDVKLPSINMK